jgi:hypothetical protein
MFRKFARLAAAFVLVLIEPEAPAVRLASLVVREAGHERKHCDQAFAVNKLDKSRIADHVALGLQATVQDHDHRDRRTGLEIVRYSDCILASTRPGLVRSRQRSLDDCGGGREICRPDLGQAVAAPAARAIRRMSEISLVSVTAGSRGRGVPSHFRCIAASRL